MNRQEFIEQLRRLLDDIPASERQDALNYYENYFEDAGPENEAKIIEELESPEKVAASIKKDLFGEDYAAYEYMNNQKKQDKIKEDNAKAQRNILIAILVVLTFPIWIGLLGGLFGMVVGLFAGVVGIGAALIACVAVFLTVGCIFIGVGIVKAVMGFPAVGLIISGIGMFMLALGIAGAVALAWLVWAVGKLVPQIVRKLADLCSSLFHRGQKKEVL